MKTLPLLLLLPLSFLASTPAFAQVNCTTYFGGETSCYSAGGYHAEGRQYFGGVEGWYDNRGNTATVRHDPFGGTSIDTSRPPITYIPSIVIPQAASSGRGFNEVNQSSGRALQPSSASQDERVYDYSQPIPDKSKLPKTPEEYRLSLLQMKAVDEKNFEKAEELGRLLRMEKFANATVAERVYMFNKALATDRLELMRSLDYAEQRIRSERGPAGIAPFLTFKQRALKYHREHQAHLQKDFEEQVVKWKLEEEGNTRFAKLEAELAILWKLQMDAVELEKREAELLSKWAEAEEEQKKKLLTILDAQLDRLIAKEAIGGKVKGK